MSRRMTDLVVAVVFATVVVGLSAQARSGPTSQPARAPKAAADPTADGSNAASIHDLLQTVQQTRDDVRKLRGDVEELRKLLESKAQSNPPTPMAGSSQVYRVMTTYFGDGDKKVKVFYVMPIATDDHRPFVDNPPTDDEILQSLPHEDKGLLFGVCKSEIVRKSVRIAAVDKILDTTGECRFYPLVGNARLKKCCYKCMIYCDQTTRSDWPIPFMNVHPMQVVVYINRDHLIRCADSDPPEKHDPH
jgi:hypothetical protein